MDLSVAAADPAQPEEATPLPSVHQQELTRAINENAKIMLKLGQIGKLDNVSLLPLRRAHAAFIIDNFYICKYLFFLCVCNN